MTDAYKRLNHEWIEWEDPSTKIPYYENTVTGEVSWDRPNIPEAYVAASQPVVDTAAIEAARREAAEREAEQQRQAAAAAAERERQREREYEMQRQAAIKAEKERIEQEKARQQAEREAAEREALERAEQLERECQAAILAERERQAKAAAEERARIEAERVRILKQQQDLIEQQKRELELQLQKLQQQQAALLEQAQVLSQQQQQLTTTPLQQQVAEVELQIDRKRGESQSFAAQIAKRAAAVQGTSAALSAGVPGTGSASVSSSPSVAQRSIQTASSIPNTHPGIVPSESLNRSSLTPTGGTITPPAGSTAPLSFAEQLAAKLASKQQQQPIATPHLTGSITPQTLLASPPPPATNTGVPAAPVAPTPAAAAASAAAAPVATPSGSGTYPPPPAPAPNRSPPLLSSTINASAGGARVVSGVPGTPGYVPPPPRPGSASPAMGATQPNQSSPTMAYTQFQPPPLTSPTTTTAAAPVPAATATATPVAPTPAKSEPVAVPVIQPPAYVRGTSLSSSPPTIDPYTPVGNTPQRSSLSSSSTPSTTTPTLRTSTSSTSTSTSTSANYEPVTPTSATGVQAKTTQPVASPKTDTRTAPKPPSSQVSTSIPVTHHRDESLAEYSFAAFSAKNFNPENRAEGGLFKKQGSISDLAVFTKQIAKPLIKQLPIPLHKDALQTFKNVTSYMGDRRSSKDGHGHATKLLYMGINTPGLRDEIYCQLIKQTTQNPRIESEMRGWELLSMCCSVFPPSQEFHHYLSVHLQQSESTEYKSRQAIADTAAYCRQMLPITMRRGNRLLVPSPNELTAMMSRRPVDVKVELLDETFQVVLAWPQMTVREFYDKLVGLLGYKLPTYHGVPLFGLYQVATDAGMFVMESPLGDETRIMDVVSGWYQGQKKALAKNANSQLQFKLIFKAKYFVHAYLTKEVLSEECLHLYYIQAAADVVSHHLHFPLYEAVKLAALMLRVAEFNGDLKDHIHKYISVRHINQELGGKTTLAKARASKKPVKELDALIAQVLGAYQPKREMTKSQAKRALLDACIKHPLYGCHTFAVTYAVDARPNDWERKLKKWGDTQPTLQAFTGSGKNALKEPEDVWLGLGEKGVVLIDKLTREVKRHDPLHTIAKYDYTKDTFFYYVKTIEYDGSFESAQQRVQAIRCEQAQAEKIVSLIEFYWRTSNQPGTAPAGVEKSTPSTSISGTTAPSVTSPTNASVAQVTAATAALNVNVNAQPVTVGQGSWLASPTAGTAASPYHNAQTLASPSSNGYANPMSPTAVVSPTATASSTYAPPPAQHGYAQPQAQPQGYAQQQQQQAYPQAQAYPQQQQQQPQAQAYAAPSQQGYPAPPAQQARPAAAAAGYVQASPSMASRQFAPPPITSPTYTTQQLNPNNVAHFGPPGPTYGNNAPQIQ